MEATYCLIFCWVWSGMSGHAQSAPKQQIANILGKSWVIVLSFCMQSDIHESYKLILLFQLDVGTHTMVYWKYSE